MNFKLFFEQTSIEVVDIDDILPHKDDLEVAVDSLHKGMPSPDKRPIKLAKFNNKYILIDGHHRLLQSILDGNNTIKATVETPDYNISDNGTVELDSSLGNFYGLEDLLENGWLLNRL